MDLNHLVKVPSECSGSGYSASQIFEFFEILGLALRPVFCLEGKNPSTNSEYVLKNYKVFSSESPTAQLELNIKFR